MMGTDTEPLHIEITSTDQIDTIALSLAMNRALRKGWFTEQQMDEIIEDARRFRVRIANGEMISTADLDAPTSTEKH
jgi:hypothetical protein